MSENKNKKLSAYFPGLIDVCTDAADESIYLIAQDDELVLLKEFTNPGSGMVVPPDPEDFPFTMPRAAEVLRHVGKEDITLYSDVVVYLRRFSELDECQRSMVALYIFLTYLHDHHDINYCPIILFYAGPERGKSRTGKSVAYLAFRGVHMIGMREPNIFRFSQNHHGTLFLDLKDVWKEAKRNNCEDILLGRFEKGQKISRVVHPEKGPYKDMAYYEIYGPTIIASNEQLHQILGTRCLPIVMPNRPGDYESPKPELALELKERLTAWRAKTLFRPLPKVEPIEGISGRLWDISKSLFQVGSLVNPQGRILLQEAMQTIAGDRRDSKKNSTEGHLIGIIKDLSATQGQEELTDWTIKTSDILRKYNEGLPDKKQVSPQWIGKKLKSLDLRHRTVNGRSEIVLTSCEYEIILSQYGFSRKEPAPESPNPTGTLPKKTLHFRMLQ